MRGPRRLRFVADHGAESDIPPGVEGEGAAGVNIEQVAALKPDLILAINDFGLELDYANLAKLAPTVGYATAWGKQSRQEQTMVGARALGLEERGQQVVAETEAATRAARDANPGLVGRTVTYSFAFGPGQIVTLKVSAGPQRQAPAGVGDADSAAKPVITVCVQETTRHVADGTQTVIRRS